MQIRWWTICGGLEGPMTQRAAPAEADNDESSGEPTSSPFRRLQPLQTKRELRHHRALSIQLRLLRFE